MILANIPLCLAFRETRPMTMLDFIGGCLEPFFLPRMAALYL
jgi:hypothetical protein